MKNIFLLLIIVIGIFSCKNNGSPLENEVMAIHDEVMPKMGKLDKAAKNLQTLLESTTDRDEKVKIIRTMKDLKDANESMMVWMEQYDVPEDKTEAIKYLTGQKDAIQKVANDMNNSLLEAQKILKNNE